MKNTNSVLVRLLLFAGVMLATCLLFVKLPAFLLLQSQRAELREAGYPATIEEIDEWWPEPLPDSDARPLFEEASRVLGLRSFDHTPLLLADGTELSMYQRMTQEQVDGDAKYLRENADGLAVLNAALAREGYSLPGSLSDLNSWYNTHDLPGQLMALSRLTRRITHYQAQERGAAAALDEVERALGYQTMSEPFIMGLLIRSAVTNVVDAGLQTTLSIGRPNDEDLDRADSIVARRRAALSDSEALIRAVISELHYMCSFASRIGFKTEEESWDDPDMPVLEFGLPRLDSAVLATQRWTRNRLFEARGIAYWLLGVPELARWAILKRGLHVLDSIPDSDASARQADWNLESPAEGRLEAAVAKAFDLDTIDLTTTFSLISLCLDRCTAVEIAIAVERYRNAHGSLPSTLDFLDRPAPLSIRRETPLQYQVEGDSYALFYTPHPYGSGRGYDFAIREHRTLPWNLVVVRDDILTPQRRDSLESLIIPP